MGIGKGACSMSRGSFGMIMLASAMMAAAMHVTVYRPTRPYDSGMDAEEIEKAHKRNRRAKIIKRRR